MNELQVQNVINPSFKQNDTFCNTPISLLIILTTNIDKFIANYIYISYISNKNNSKYIMQNKYVQHPTQLFYNYTRKVII